MIGYDFNGVVDTGRYVPTPHDVIITGNTIPMVDSVLQWLKDHGIICAVYFNPYPQGANNQWVSGYWKAEIIKKLRLVSFYEDDPIQYEIIKNYCPETQIIKV